MSKPTLHLRSEDKPSERRSMLTPTTTKALVDEGYTVNVERRHSGNGGNTRIFEDHEFEKAGATLVPTGSWPKAPRSHLIVGLKELPEEDFDLEHEFISFAHVFKGQTGSEKVLSRFSRGGGKLYDLEFLQHDNGRRVAAFGYHAGYAGSALALLAWAHQVLAPDTPFAQIKPYENQEALVSDVNAQVTKAHEQVKRWPRILVMGALGRCGSGAVQACRDVRIPDESILRWDMEETKAGGPFDEIVESDIFVNCIYLMGKIPPFVTKEQLSKPSRKLSIVCDVSCDPNSPNNPVPIYEECTTFTNPLVQVKVEREPKLSVIAIDHLPSLMPREASEAFSNDLLPHLKVLHRRHEEPVWTRAEKIYHDKVAELVK